MAVRKIEVRERVMARNNEIAADVRSRLAEHGVTAINLVSSPGSGKTTLLERTLAFGWLAYGGRRCRPCYKIYRQCFERLPRCIQYGGVDVAHRRDHVISY